MALKPLRHESAHSPRHLGLSGARVGFFLEFGEHARSGARHARLRALLSQPRKLRCHLGVAGGDERLEIVRSLPREKGRYFESFRRACLFFLIIRRPPRSTLFPYTTSSD